MISRISACNLLLPVITPIQLSKIFFGFALPPTTESNAFARKALFSSVRAVVGLGRLELPTSPLSGVRSNHLSYRPNRKQGRQAWWSWSGSNRRPPECKSGALPAELQPLVSCGAPTPQQKKSRGRLDALDASDQQKTPRNNGQNF